MNDVVPLKSECDSGVDNVADISATYMGERSLYRPTACLALSRNWKLN